MPLFRRTRPADIPAEDPWKGKAHKWGAPTPQAVTARRKADQARAKAADAKAARGRLNRALDAGAKTWHGPTDPYWLRNRNRPRPERFW